MSSTDPTSTATTTDAASSSPATGAPRPTHDRPPATSGSAGSSTDPGTSTLDQPAGSTVATGTGARLARAAQRQGALAVLVVAVLVASVVFPSFGTLANATNIGVQSAFLALVALGLTFVIFTGGIDLSVGSVFALSGVLAAWGAQYGTVVVIVLPLAVAALFGLAQGAVIAFGGLPPFIVTLAGLLLARGVLLLVSDEGSTTYRVPADSPFLTLGQGVLLGIPVPIWITVVLFAAAGLVLRRTTFGATTLAVGGQPDAALLMGLPVARTKLLSYVASAVLASLGGVLIAAYTSSGVTVLGVGLELKATAAVVLGGTLLTGGAGTVLGTLVGVLLLRVIQNVINQVGTLNSNWQAVVTGGVLLVVVTLQRWLTRVQRR